MPRVRIPHAPAGPYNARLSGEVRMDELVKTLAQRIGISEDQARTAVELVVGHLKNRLPAPLAGQIDSALSGKGGMGGILGGM